MTRLLEQGTWILKEFSKGLPGALSGTAWQVLDAAPVIDENALCWKQPFASIDQEIWVVAEGLEGDVLVAAFANLGRAMSTCLGRQIAPLPGAQTDEKPPELRWASLKLASATLSLGVPAEVEELFAKGLKAEGKTFDLLLDVELPVSVSFGRAQVPLKDVLKLTTGSIVELNRAIVEPVDIVVNNCVIARGEVVVVEGNFGVRIQHVVSRGERLRSVQ